MKFYRIILLLGFIRVVENQAAPRAVGVTSTCEKSKWKWVFVLRPEANEINRLTRLVESVRSAIIKRPKTDNGDVNVIVAPEDFEEFRKKTQFLKVHKSHSLQCIELTNNFPTSTSRSATTSKKLVKASKSLKSRQAPRGGVARSSMPRKIGEELSKCSKILGRPSSENFMTNLTSNGVEKLWKETIESRKLDGQSSNENSILSTTMQRFVVTSSPRTPKLTTKRLNAMKMATKSRGRTISNVKKGEKLSKKSSRNESTGNKNGTRGLKERSKHGDGNQTGSSARKATLERSWTNLISTTPYSFKKASLIIPSLTETSKNSEKQGKNSSKSSDHFSSLARVGSLKKMNITKKFPPERSESLKTKNTTKSIRISSVPTSKRPKPSIRPVWTTKQPVGFVKSRGSNESKIVPNTKTKKVTTSLMAKDCREKRYSGESALRQKCRLNKLRKNKLQYVRSNISPVGTSSGCHIIKIMAYCGDNESEKNCDNSSRFVSHGSVNEPVDSMPDQVPQLGSFLGSDGSNGQLSSRQSYDLMSDQVLKARTDLQGKIDDFAPNEPDLVPADETHNSEVLHPVLDPTELIDDYSIKNLENGESFVPLDELEQLPWQTNELADESNDSDPFLSVKSDKSSVLSSGEVRDAPVEYKNPSQIFGYTSKPEVSHRKPLKQSPRPEAPPGRPLKPLLRPEMLPGRALRPLPRPEVPPERRLNPLQRPEMLPGRALKPLPRPEMLPGRALKPLPRPEVPPRRVLKPLPRPEVPPERPLNPLQRPEVPSERPLNPLQRPEMLPGRALKPLPRPEVPPERPLNPLQKPETLPGRALKPLTRPEVPSGRPLKPLPRPEVPPERPLNPLQKPEVPPGLSLKPLSKPEAPPEQSLNPLQKPEMPSEGSLDALPSPEAPPTELLNALPRPEMPHESPLQPLQRPEMSSERPLDILRKPEEFYFDYTDEFNGLHYHENDDENNIDFSSHSPSIASIVNSYHESTESPLKSSSISLISATDEETADGNDDEDDDENYDYDGNDDDDDGYDDDDDNDENYSDD